MGIHSGAGSRLAFRAGWPGLVLTTLAQIYLVFLLTLTVIATVPLLFGWNGSVVQTSSMQPSISPGDVVLSAELSEDSPVPVGGVVEFNRPSIDGSHTVTVLHRIVHDNGDGSYVTAGDANAEVDSTPITRDQITGQGRLLIPYIGLPALWMGAGKLPAVAIWTVATLAAAVLASTGIAAARRRDGEQGDDDDNPVEYEPIPESRASRRAVLGVVLGTVVVGSSLIPRERLDAAFTARTSSVNNSWSAQIPQSLNVGRLTPYVMFAGRSVINNGFFDFSTYLNGSVGTSPGSTIQGFYSWQISGGTDRNNQVAKNARADAVALYAAVDARPTTKVISSKLTKTIGPGTYKTKSGDFSVTDTLTLDAKGDPSAIFVFSSPNIAVQSDANMKLINGASARNIYWRATGTITLGQNSVNSGTFLAGTSAVSERNADLTGRLVCLEGDVQVDRTSARTPA